MTHGAPQLALAPAPTARPRARRGGLVCITGIDGAGKTTVARALVARLRAEGIRAEYRYTRYVPLLLRPLIWASRALFLRKRDPFRDYAAHRDAKRRATSRHPFLAALYRGVLRVDYAAQIAWKVGLPRLLGSTIVCDRYVYDTVVTDLSVDFGLTLDETVRRVHGFMRASPRPDLIVFLDLPPEAAFARKDDVPDPAYLHDRRQAYLRVAEALSMVRVDARPPPEEVAEAVWKETKQVMFT